jgi:purine-binding chemotaxis protein CheW
MRDVFFESRMSNEPIHDHYLHDRPRVDTSLRSVQLFRAGSFLCGIFENQVAIVEPWREPTPLPQAPATVLGVVSIQGRMLTVLNLAMLLDSNAVSADRSPQHILALRGDEQLALAVEAVANIIEIGDGLLDELSDSGEGLVLGVIKHDGAEITILNVKGLFPTAIQGRERRRRRF